jgi:hypothetical protein
MEVLEYGVEDFVGGKRMVVVKVIIGSCLYVNMELFYYIQINQPTRCIILTSVFPPTQQIADVTPTAHSTGISTYILGASISRSMLQSCTAGSQCED